MIHPEPASAARPASDGAPPFWSVVPAGGAGTRLWPLSRASRPKFLLPLLSERSLLQQTIDRLGPLSAPARTLVVCGPAHAAAIAHQLPEMPAANVVIEPFPRGSGPAIGLAAALITRSEPDAVMGSFAADHDVRDEVAFATAVRGAIAAAQQGWLATIGLTPTRPETGYGYIERTDEAVVGTGADTAYRAARFVEKPDLPRATEFVASGRYLWNASMFVWKAQTLLDELARLQPALHAGLARVADAWGSPEQERVTAEVWSGLPEITIDHGVMEHAARVAVVPAAMGWSDIGDWHGLGTLLAADELGISGRGDHVPFASAGSVVWSQTNRIVALVGVEHLIVVDTEDALLVADRSRAQDVRRIVDLLRGRGQHDLL